MNITRRTDYAIRTLMLLAEKDGEVVSVREISETQDVPYAFARSIQRDLVKAELAKTKQGTKGGLFLARSPEDISLLEIVEAMQGDVSCSVCSKDPSWCSRHGGCKAHRVWREVDAMLKENLKQKTLAELV